MSKQNSRVETQDASWENIVPLALGILLTVGFYYLIPHLPVYQELIQRYFCSHPLEYASAGLFFAGLSVLLVKGIRFASEQTALQETTLDSESLLQIPDPINRAVAISDAIRALPPGRQSSWYARRISDVANYVYGRKSATGLEDHLKYLSELAVERLHGSYALVRTITWAVPIVGFLGTVIGITIAIANVTPDQLDSSLQEVTGGLAVAFDTTALALTLSIVLVFATFVVERSENKLLSDVELAGMNQLANLFPEEETGRPIINAECEVADQILANAEALIGQQTRLWEGSLQTMRERWIETLERQQQSWEAALQRELSQTFSGHAEQLEQSRDSYLQSLEGVSQRIVDSLEQSQSAQREQQETFARTLSAVCEQIRSDFAGQQSAWKEQAEATASQLDALNNQADALLKLVEAEDQLARTQSQLGETLQALRTAESFDEALHNLSAAVHLLTAKTRPQAA